MPSTKKDKPGLICSVFNTAKRPWMKPRKTFGVVTR